MTRTLTSLAALVISGLLFNTANASSTDAALKQYDDFFATAEKDWRMRVWSIGGKDTKPSFTEGASSHSPWSGSSWSFNRGSTALRYKSQAWRDLTNGDVYSRLHVKLYEFYEQSPPYLMDVVSKDAHFAPTEKYDIVLDDMDFGLTNSTWDKLFTDFDSYTRAYQKIPDYFGFCDGWAISSSVHKKPMKPVTLTSAEGRKVTFDVPDIRALTAMYHQHNPNINYDFLGTRCTEGYACDIVHPGLFHIAVMNRIGHDKMPMLFDSSKGAAVWNKVVKGFNVEYFNPHNAVSTDRKGTNIFNYRSNYLKNDQHGNKQIERAAGTQFIVGVKLTLDVVRLRTQYDTVDATQPYSYYYELELDGNNNIVGGEWLARSGSEPDFIWFVNDTQVFDVDYPDSDVIPADVSRKAGYDSHTIGKVHPWIIKQLIERSAE